MINRITFLAVSDPARTAATGISEDGIRAHVQLPIDEPPIGAKEKFSEDFGSYMRTMFPAMVVADDLKVYHQPLTSAEMTDLVREIRTFLIRWNGNEEFVETPL